jgi:hypothetical protein
LYIRLELKLGANVLWDSGASDQLSGVSTAHAWWFKAVCQAYNSTANTHGGGCFGLSKGGSASPVAGEGFLVDTNAVAANQTLVGTFYGLPVTTNMTVAQPLTFSVTLDTYPGTLSMALDYARFEVT